MLEIASLMPPGIRDIVAQEPEMRQFCPHCNVRIKRKAHIGAVMHPELKVPCIRCGACGEVISLFK